jgi:hypothetical protein
MQEQATQPDQGTRVCSRDRYAHLEQQVAERAKELAALDAIAATVSQYLDSAPNSLLRSTG